MKIILSMLVVLLAAQAVFAAGIQDIKLNDINDKPTSLKAYDGKVVLLVNVASRCGNTPQYAGLQAMYEKYKDKGFVIVGVPCNDFLGQEPGIGRGNCQILHRHLSGHLPAHGKNPCQRRRNNIPFTPRLTGDQGHPRRPRNQGRHIDWNFAKFVIGRDGKAVKRFKAGVKPDNADLVKTVETALAAK